MAIHGNITSRTMFYLISCFRCVKQTPRYVDIRSDVRYYRWSLIRKFGLLYQPDSLFKSAKIRRYFSTRPASTANEKPSRTKSIEWRGVLTRFLPIGMCLVAVMQWRFYRTSTAEKRASRWQISIYRMLPLRTLSRYWGWIADKHLPEFVRPFVYGFYSYLFSVNLSEALNEDLKSYRCLADFFSRELKDNVREVHKHSPLVSPCDGTVLHVGRVCSGEIEQVKGVTYQIEDFFGSNTFVAHNYVNLAKEQSKNNCLYQIIIYLAPGDYHRFHSPANWTPTHRRHFHGDLLSVSPNIAKWLPGLFCLNERVVYFGNWQHGFFSFSAVGATNVGTIKVYFDKTLQTNIHKKTCKTKDLCLGNSISLKKGDNVGEFRMGSTIVLIFQAPGDFSFDVSPGQKVKMGQSLCETRSRDNFSTVKNRGER